MDILITFLREMIELLYNLFGDYGVAIVMITLIVRLALLPFNLKQYRQVENQKIIAEKIEKAKRDYRTNEKKKEEEIRRIYQENGTGLGGCAVLFLQFPVMIGLYNAIRMISDKSCVTILIPWVSSLMQRDQSLVLPIVTIFLQMLPQLFPYLRMFKGLCRQKASWSQIMILMGLNSSYLFLMPSGVGLYCLTSAVIQALEQFIFFFMDLQRIKKLNEGGVSYANK